MITALAAGMLVGCGKKEEAAPGKLAQIKTEDYLTLGEYTGLTVSHTEPVVTEDELQAEIFKLMDGRVELQEVTGRAVQNWDTATIDFVGRENGVAFEGGTGEDYPLVIGSGSFIPGFEEGLVGVKTGETKEIELTFPENYSPQMGGKTVLFTVTVQKIEAYPLTDETAKQVSPETPTVQELRQAIYDRLYVRATQSFEQSAQTKLIGELEAGCEWKKDVPEELVQNYLNRIKSNLERIAQLSNTTMEQILYNQFGIQESQFEASFLESAKNGVKEDIMVQAIANAQNLNPTEEELEAARAEGMENGGYESMEAYREAVGEEYYNHTLRDYLMADKVMSFLMENNTIERLPSERIPAVIDGTQSSAEETDETQETESEQATQETDQSESEPVSE